MEDVVNYALTNELSRFTKQYLIDEKKSIKDQLNSQISDLRYEKQELIKRLDALSKQNIEI